MGTVRGPVLRSYAAQPGRGGRFGDLSRRFRRSLSILLSMLP